jgi:hypothetical protein
MPQISNQPEAEQGQMSSICMYSWYNFYFLIDRLLSLLSTVLITLSFSLFKVEHHTVAGACQANILFFCSCVVHGYTSLNPKLGTHCHLFLNHDVKFATQLASTSSAGYFVSLPVLFLADAPFAILLRGKILSAYGNATRVRTILPCGLCFLQSFSRR